MREKGVRVLTVREILAFGTSDHVGARVELEQFAMEVGWCHALLRAGWCWCFDWGGAGEVSNASGWYVCVKVLGEVLQRLLCRIAPHHRPPTVHPSTQLLLACIDAPALSQALTYQLVEGSKVEDIKEKDLDWPTRRTPTHSPTPTRHS